MERLDRLQSPRLTLLALGLGPHDRLPVGRKHEAGTRAVDLDPIAAWLVHIQEERLLHGVLVRTGFDVNAVLQTDTKGTAALGLARCYQSTEPC